MWGAMFSTNNPCLGGSRRSERHFENIKNKDALYTPPHVSKDTNNEEVELAEEMLLGHEMGQELLDPVQPVVVDRWETLWGTASACGGSFGSWVLGSLKQRKMKRNNSYQDPNTFSRSWVPICEHFTSVLRYYVSAANTFVDSHC